MTENVVQKLIKPTPPGPCRTEAEQSKYAQDMAKWSDWVAEHPEEDAKPAEDA